LKASRLNKVTRRMDDASHPALDSDLTAGSQERTLLSFAQQGG